MKFQDSSFNGLKVTVSTKSVTHAPTHPLTHAPKAICPINFFKVGGIKKLAERGFDPRTSGLSARRTLPLRHSAIYVYIKDDFDVHMHQSTKEEKLESKQQKKLGK